MNTTIKKITFAISLLLIIALSFGYVIVVHTDTIKDVFKHGIKGLYSNYSDTDKNSFSEDMDSVASKEQQLDSLKVGDPDLTVSSKIEILRKTNTTSSAKKETEASRSEKINTLDNL